MSGTPNGLPRLYTPAEVAEALHRSKWWVLDQARHRRIPHCWIGGGYLFTAEHVTEIVRMFEVQPIEASVPLPTRGHSGLSTAGASSGSGMRLVARVPRRVRAVHHDEAA
jgi:hypothetical protein